MLPQDDLTGKSLASAVNGLMDDEVAREEMASRALARGKPQAAEDIVSNLLTLVH
jgi:UDP-N-acetylglucosamine:LPS N-acetylglucosamine transferase